MRGPATLNLLLSSIFLLTCFADEQLQSNNIVKARIEVSTCFICNCFHIFNSLNILFTELWWMTFEQTSSGEEIHLRGC
jgi:hypothetical protein